MRTTYNYKNTFSYLYYLKIKNVETCYKHHLEINWNIDMYKLKNIFSINIR